MKKVPNALKSIIFHDLVYFAFKKIKHLEAHGLSHFGNSPRLQGKCLDLGNIVRLAAKFSESCSETDQEEQE